MPRQHLLAPRRRFSSLETGAWATLETPVSAWNALEAERARFDRSEAPGR